MLVIMTSLEVGNCGECPFVQQCAEQLGRFATMKEAITLAVTQDSVDDEIAPAILEFLQASPDLAEGVLADVSSKEDVAARLRKSAATIMNLMDNNDEALIEIANAGTAVCKGPLKMRASKDGSTITATICNNPLLPAGEQIEDVVVNRRPR